MAMRVIEGIAEKVEDFRVDTFLEAIEEVYRAYGLSLRYYDLRGKLIVENLCQSNVNWLRASSIGRFVEPAEPIPAVETAHVG